MPSLRRRSSLEIPDRHSRRRSASQSGQVLPIFVVMSVVLLGAAALVVDVSWLWANQQRMQRAADAGALAGAIYLPGDEAAAFGAARAEALKNGFADGTGGVAVTPRRDPTDPRKLLVDVNGQIDTFFARVLCFDGGPCLQSADVGVTGAASYVMPVPMGSPQNYYGVGYLVDAITRTTSTRVDAQTAWRPTTATISGTWVNPGNARFDDNAYATTSTTNASHQWGTFSLQSAMSSAGLPAGSNDSNVFIDGIEVRLNDVFINSSSSSCRIDAQLSWNGGGSWSATAATGSLSTSTTDDRTLGSATSTASWDSHTWRYSEINNTNFRVRLTWAGCASSRTVSLDLLEVRISFHYDQTTTTTTIEPVDVRSPRGDILTPHNFWGAVNSQGAPNIQGDAYLTYYDTRTSVTNSDYKPLAYYNYAVQLPAGSSAGEVWIFDPGFCDVASNDKSYGTGEYYTLGGANGSSSRQPVSTFYDLYDTRNTPYDTSDDVLIASSGSQFQRLSLSDHALGVTAATDCSGLAWHNDWWRIAGGLPGGRTYRLHTYSTDAANPNDQRGTTAHNAFAIWATASGGTPRVHGLGAMEAYVRLPGGRASEFYLAQIDAEHAGKTMVIRLWDPGDTGSLAAELQILRPTTSTYQATTFSYTAKPNSGAASSCASRSGTRVSSVTTNTGGSSLYNGCWLTIEIPLPSDYAAPLPTTDTVASEGGWWKIRYNMSGSTSSNSTDLTTWQVELRGSPVHLVLE